MMKKHWIYMLSAFFFMTIGDLKGQGKDELLIQINADLADIDSLRKLTTTFLEVKSSMKNLLSNLKSNQNEESEGTRRARKLYGKFEKEIQYLEEQFQIENIDKADYRLKQLKKKLVQGADPPDVLTLYEEVPKLPAFNKTQRNFRNALWKSEKGMLKGILVFIRWRWSGNGIALFNIFGDSEPDFDGKELESLMNFTKEMTSIYSKLENALVDNKEEENQILFKDVSEFDIDSTSAYLKLIERNVDEGIYRLDSILSINEAAEKENRLLSQDKSNLEEKKRNLEALYKELEADIEEREAEFIAQKLEIQAQKIESEARKAELNRLRNEKKMELAMLTDQYENTKTTLGHDFEVANDAMLCKQDSLRKVGIELGNYVTTLRLRQNVFLIPSLSFLGLLVLILVGWLFNRKEKLKKSNDMLQLTFRELHHRTKNNIRMVSAMMGLQAMNVKSEEAAKALNEGKNRLNAIGLVHGKLYQGNSLTRVEMNGYVQELLEYLKISFDYEDRPLQINSQVENIEMEADNAIPVGVLINEVVTNAFKHAFENNPSPQLTIRLEKSDEDYVSLFIKDNGNGFPEVNVNNPRSFGLKTIKMLVETQMDGSYVYEFENGTIFSAKLKYQ